MKRAVVAMMFSSLLMVAVGTGSDAAAGGAPQAVQQAATVTVRGVFEHIAVEAQDGEDIRYAVRGDERSWWLEGVPEPVPASGTEVEIIGTPRDEYTLTVDT